MPLSSFLPPIRSWFEEHLGAPTEAQLGGWKAIRSGKNCLIAAPTGSGKTLAAFLCAIDQLAAQGANLQDRCEVVYLSPLKALGNDIQKNLRVPLEGIRKGTFAIPEIRVAVRTGDTTQSERAAMLRRPPHILVTTPESLYLLLTSNKGREMLSRVKTVIVDEIHALCANKRGSHLSLSLERLAALCGEFQRIGLSATQKPIEEVAHFLVGAERECEVIDTGHLRELDLEISLPPSSLQTVCSHEVWDEIYAQIVQMIVAHRTTLVFVNTRRFAERIAARLSETLEEHYNRREDGSEPVQLVKGDDLVTSHHGSLSKRHRLDAEKRLKEGKLKALVATASLELGIDIGDVDLVIQVGTTPSIATFLQRVGRAGHGVGRVPKGRLIPLTQDELVCAAGLLRAIHQGRLDSIEIPAAPLDVLAQQCVAACVPEVWDQETLYRTMRRAWPYRELKREDFDAVIRLHTEGRLALLHRDEVYGRLMATKRARMTALLNGGVIPDTGEYRVIAEPNGHYVGSVDEDFAIESSRGDILQLGNMSWRILRIETGVLRVADAHGAPPTIPFWFGEAPARTVELSAAVCELREAGHDEAWLEAEVPGLPQEGRAQIAEYLVAGKKALGAIPTQDRIIAERFFDESGGMQLVLHAPFGGRINRALGLAIRKRFCRGFGFELQAAANEEAIVLSLGTVQSFELPDIYEFLHPETARHVLTQALLDRPLFLNRWRWNLTRALLLKRMDGGKKVPLPIQRFRAEDMLAKAFPSLLACPENLPGGDLEVPEDHPIVTQSIHDALTEAMDVERFLELVARIREGSIEKLAVDTAEPSPFARGILNAAPYAFLDDAPLEERRTQAVLQRRGLDVKTADDLGALDPEAIARVRAEAWPSPQNEEEVHEALCWMGYVRVDEAPDWLPWLEALQAAGRVRREGDRFFAVEASRDPLDILRGRLEALGPVHDEDPAYLRLQAEGEVLRVRFENRDGWCNRRLLARIRRYTLDRLRGEIQPVNAATFLRFLTHWQHTAESARLVGPEGLHRVLHQLQGFHAPAAQWEASILRSRIRGYRREWLDQLTFTGEIAWGRFFGKGNSPIRTTPITILPYERKELWLGLRNGSPGSPGLSATAQDILDLLRARGALFAHEIKKRLRLLPSQLEGHLGELIAQGLLTCDSFNALRQLLVPPSRRKAPLRATGRWSLLSPEDLDGDSSERPHPDQGRDSDQALRDLDKIARALLDRWGVVFRRVLLRESLPIRWGDLLRRYRRLELRGELRGGRFVEGFDGEQFALSEAVTALRRFRREQGRGKQGDSLPLEVPAADPLNLRGILTPEKRVSPLRRGSVSLLED
ncbi:MAG TPA: DEAD/DEAH box helicase [Planctomycetes bacterium]|nr:DEAD/DEAH box helicase [Planctomycetota bacterium]